MMGVIATGTGGPLPTFVADVPPQLAAANVLGQYNLSLPAGLEQNDVIFALVATSSAAISIDASGWTLLTAGRNQNLFWVRRGASNPAILVGGLFNVGAVSSWCAAYRGCRTSGNPFELFSEIDVSSRYSEETIDNGGPLTAANVRPAGANRLVLNFMQTAITWPAAADSVQPGTDNGWTSRLDSNLQGTDGQITWAHCWAAREIAGVSAVVQPGVTFSGGDCQLVGGQQERVGAAFSLALL